MIVPKLSKQKLILITHLLLFKTIIHINLYDMKTEFK